MSQADNLPMADPEEPEARRHEARLFHTEHGSKLVGQAEEDGDDAWIKSNYVVTF